MRRLGWFLAGVITGLVAAYYGAWVLLYRHLTRGVR